MARVLITGATGFIGRRICSRLLEAGCRVRALVRSPQRAKTLLAGTVELIEGAYTIELALAGHKPQRRRIEVVANQPQALPVFQMQLTDGKLVLRSEPSGATVRLTVREDERLGAGIALTVGGIPEGELPPPQAPRTSATPSGRGSRRNSRPSGLPWRWPRPSLRPR